MITFFMFLRADRSSYSLIVNRISGMADTESGLVGFTEAVIIGLLAFVVSGNAVFAAVVCVISYFFIMAAVNLLARRAVKLAEQLGCV